MSQKKNVDIEIANIKNLPPLPEESIRIMTAVNDEDIAIDTLVKELALSPALVARLLGLANSAFFGRAGKINDLRVAIIQVLGLNLVKSLTLSIILNVELKTSKCKAFDSSFYWNHALITALISQELAKQMNNELMPPSIVYTSGLLLNIGLLAAVHIYPADLNEVFSKTDRIEGSILIETRTLLGKSQYEMGGLLLERWKLPDIYQTTVKQFRQPNFEGEEKSLLELLELSHWAAVYIVENKRDEIPDFSELLSKLSLSHDCFIKVVNEVDKNKDNIQELASVISG